MGHPNEQELHLIMVKDLREESHTKDEVEPKKGLIEEAKRDDDSGKVTVCLHTLMELSGVVGRPITIFVRCSMTT